MWLMKSCPDQYGQCIRQYVVCGISFLIVILGIISVFELYRKERKIVFELILLMLSTFTSLVMFALFLQVQIISTHLILMTLQVYAYFLLLFGFLCTQQNRNRSNIFFVSAIPLILKVFFLVFTCITLLIIITCIIVSSKIQFQCRYAYYGIYLIIGLQIPIYILNGIYLRKARIQLQQISVMSRRDGLYMLRLMQIRWILVGLLVNFMMHLLRLALTLILSVTIDCFSDSNQIKVDSYQLVLVLAIANITQLLPPILIPYIFWYLPLRLNKSAQSIHIPEFASLQD